MEVPIGAATVLSFTLSCAGKTFKSELPLEINRLSAAAGAFTLPAFPVAIIYAPPVDKSQKNVSKWPVANNTGNTTTVSFSKTNNSSHPVLPEFDNANVMASGVERLFQSVCAGSGQQFMEGHFDRAWSYRGRAGFRKRFGNAGYRGQLSTQRHAIDGQPADRYHQ